MSERVFNKIISKTGEVVTVRPRQTTTDSTVNSPTFEFPEALWFKTKALKYDASGLREEWYVIGTDKQTDFVLSFYAYLEDAVSVNDLVELADGTLCVIVEIVKRGRGPAIDHLEVLARRSDFG